MTKYNIRAICAVNAIIAIIAGAAYLNDQIRTTEKGLALIGNAEGCMRTPYTCPADVLTVGIGTTEAVEKINRAKVYTDKEIAELFVKGVKQAENCVNEYANGKRMPQGAFEALTSITFNVGCGKLRNSTLFNMARRGYNPAMCDQFPRWIYAAGKPLKGLIERRNKERELCLAS